MRVAIFAILITTCSSTAPAQGRWEGPKTFQASKILAPEERNGPHHTVEDEVPTEGFYFAFTLHTDFGDLTPLGRDLLNKRIRETNALEVLNEVSKTEVFLEAAGRSLQSVGKGLVQVAKDPEDTAKGLGGGIKRFGVNLGRKTQRVAEDVTDGDDDTKSTTDTAENVANSVLGVNKSARVWAEKLQVDPYSRNPTLQKALLEIAKLDAAGGIAAKVAVPIPTVVSATSSVSGLVWGKDPEELRKDNEARLASLGVPDEIAEEFFRNTSFTLTDQTRFIAALHEVNATGLADYVDAARGAKTPREVLFYVESAEMLQRQHAKAPVQGVLTDSRAMVATVSGVAMALLPLDYLVWTEAVAEPSSEIAERARKELGAGGLEMHLTGQASERARQELATLGWSLRERVPLGASVETAGK